MTALLSGEPVITDQATSADQRALVISIGQAMDRTKQEAARGWTWDLAKQWVDLKRRREGLIGSLRAGMRLAS